MNLLTLILFCTLLAGGFLLLTSVASDVFGPNAWAVAVGLACLLGAVALFGWRAILVVLARGYRGLKG